MSKYDEMSREELLLAIKKKGNTEAYKWRKSITLTPAEGKKLEEEILPKFYCDNVSQLVKKIVNGQIEIFDNH